MKKILVLFLLCLIIKTSFAQKEHNIWYFGAFAGLDFNSGSPVAITNSAMSTSEGCSSISDTNGNILFYTDGIKVWNKNHVVMPNGTGLSGNSSSTQSALIVKQPGNANLYYVFTTWDSLCYSVVDISLNGGLGDVTASKNVLMINTASEKICAAEDTNRTEVWILSHESGTDGFNAFLLSSGGITTIPIHSNTGAVTSGGPGQMKFSPTSDKVAFGSAGAPNARVCVADFNATTGVVSGGLSITPTYNQVYGLEFSPNGNILYTTSNPPDTIYQYDLNAGSPAAIIASATVVGSSYPNAAASMQIAPDGKIYLSPSNSTYVDVINNPNTLGVGCNFVHNAVYLNGKISALGLPGSIASFYRSGGLPPVASFQSSDTSFCDETGKCIDFTDHSTGNPTSWQWIFTGASPDTSTQQNPTQICYYYPGTYPVTLIVSNSYGYDTLDVAPLIILHTPPSPPVVTLNGDTVFSSHASSYLWFFNGSPISGAIDSFYVATQSGKYSVQTTDSNGCVSLSFGLYVSITSVKEMINGEGIKIYPSPVSDILSVNGLNERTKITICNAIGEIVYSEEKDFSSASNTFTVSCANLSNGIYFLRLTGKETTVSKIIVQHQ